MSKLPHFTGDQWFLQDQQLQWLMKGLEMFSFFVMEFSFVLPTLNSLQSQQPAL